MARPIVRGAGQYGPDPSHAGLRGVSRRRGFVVTTRRDESQRAAPDLVKREFVANGPNQLWVRRPPPPEIE